MQNNPISWWELACPDAKATKEFFTKVFDWQITGGEFGDYSEVLAGKAENGFFGGGIYTHDKNSPAPLVLYITVEDVDAMAAKVKEHGGKITAEPFDIKGLGRLCFFTEPGGQVFGMIKRVF